MRFVNRSHVPIPGCFVGTPSVADEEHADAATYYLSPELTKTGRVKTYKHKVYKRREVVAAIDTLFRSKCAYCESVIGATQPSDIEHYRPKHHYHWLAADWSNLLASCIDCNRHRTHDSPDPRVSGKHEHFPLVAGTPKAATPMDVTTERPLLIDPTRTDPRTHFRFGDDGIVTGVGDIGETTVRVIGLDREGLRRERHRALVVIDERIDDIIRHAEIVRLDERDETAWATLAIELRRLRRALEDLDEPYTLMAIQRVRARLEKQLGLQVLFDT